MIRILVVEDDVELNKGLCRALESEDVKVVSVTCVKAAREELMMGNIALALLDESLPDGSGLTVLEEIKRKIPTMPVIMLTANDTDLDIVEGLEKGADDYITKPFSLSVLRARVNTQLRRALAGEENSSAGSDVYEEGVYHFDFAKMIYTVAGTSVELSKTEQKLLRILIENKGRTVSRANLVDRIWTDGAEYVDENALSVSVKRLRDKLNATDNIKTIYGIGYGWVNV